MSTENTEKLREAILALARRYDFEEGHSRQDERLALRLFDETARLGLHSLTAANHPAGVSAGAARDASAALLPQHAAQELDCTPRDILSYAALLHDIGYWVGYEQHHKTAFKLIMAEPIRGLSPQAQALVAHVARYHRGSTPDPARHEAFAALSAANQRLVSQLGAILRFADGLDRRHIDAVADLRCELDGRRLVVTLLPGYGDESERWAGRKKARWFEAVFEVQVVLR
jgi:exopolyphosphatase/guanosine-5'-triphosphate,3'-diphosphate pyrophosphatase